MSGEWLKTLQRRILKVMPVVEYTVNVAEYAVDDNREQGAE